VSGAPRLWRGRVTKIVAAVLTVIMISCAFVFTASVADRGFEIKP
jgi:uncharacterized membrane protein YphA (DoxX/SURF4 family)